MKLRNFKYLILSSTILFTSCSKYLDQEPDMRAEINTVDKVKRLVTSAYPSNNYLAMTETYSDNVEDKGVGELYEPVPHLYNWKDVIDSDKDTPTAYWNACYAAIAAANHALKAIEKNNFGDEVLPYKGEALVARAYNHFMLVTFFSKVYDRSSNANNDSPGIPYVTDPETITLKNYERGTVKSVYDNIRKDLEEGLSLLAGSDGAWNVPKYHFTPAAAHAFAARFYLFTGEWQKVVDNANKIFPSGNFSGKLTPFNSTFKSQDVATVRTNFTKADQVYNLLITETNSGYERWWNSRYAMGVRVTQDIYNGKTAAGAQLYNLGLNYGAPHYTTYLWKEFFYISDATAGTGYAMLMVPIFVTDEALLNRAEAYLELGNINAALADLNLFASNRINNYNPSTHAVTVAKSKEFFNLSDDKEALIQTALQFKQIGFMSMGLRWFDIIRKGITVKHNVIGNDERETFIELKPEDPRRIFQIPQEAKLAGVEQNPR
ncbi:RagB/SusD family nutrient uptake outer membrane protein [Sphingobacterium detergens]|uniref:SusD-like starch-binding protein associating with outer membrane n=1 Tax=Sphingobacterium detergens TaxID=1145106 RepID=A0A420AXW5_SPHD1|nr:RagB/SusD family nutrient uptake outer membrane protein [Sphingobacterium detergens]RKE49285.1 SusD-like starch-binding protein associating with outer membrane [Sphingobacterium detergens]